MADHEAKQNGSEAEISNGKHCDSDQSDDDLVNKTCKQGFCRNDLNHFEEYYENTTTHGIKRIFEKVSIIRRLLWLFLVIASASGLLYFIVNRGIRLSAYPKSTTVDLLQRRGLALPAITLCNQNPIRNSTITKYGLDDYLLCLEGGSLNCSQQLRPDVRRLSYLEILEEGGQSFEEFVTDCQFGIESCSNLTAIKTTFVGGRKCYTINADGKLVARSRRQALQLSFNLDVAEYSDITDIGVAIIVHSRDDPPVFETAIRIPPTNRGFISFTVDERKLLDPRYGSCGHKQLTFYPKYTRSACQQDILLQAIVNECGCLPPEAPLSVTSAANCTVEDVSCISVLELLSTLYPEDINEMCPPECNSFTYNKAVSYSFSPNPNNNITLLESYNTVNAQLQYESFTVTQFIESRAYEFGDFVSDIGGQMGLFLGASIISICEFIIFIADELKDRVFQIWRCRKKMEKKFSTKKLKIQLASVA